MSNEHQQDLAVAKAIAEATGEALDDANRALAIALAENTRLKSELEDLKTQVFSDKTVKHVLRVEDQNLILENTQLQAALNLAEAQLHRLQGQIDRFEERS